MAENDVGRKDCGSGDEKDSRGESIRNMTDESASIVRASDSDSSSVATRDSTPARERSTGASPATTGRARGSRRVKMKRIHNASVDPASRSKEETLHLIKLRDDLISAKHQEVLLLSRQNQGLREGIDAIEKEMESLHVVLEAKDDAIHKLKRESDHLRREIKRLQVEGEEHKGHENAMIVAATQNSRLLKLLEQEELKRENLLSERDEAIAEVSELKHRVRTSDERHAKRTSALEVKLIKAIGENVAFREKCSDTDERIERLEKELESSRKQATFDKGTADAALSTLRQNHYEALSQLQESRDELQRTKDQAETMDEELQAFRHQSAELEIRLGTVQSDLRSMERASSEREVSADEDSRMAQARLAKEVALSESLHDKVASMSRAMLRLVERQKDLQTEVGELHHEADMSSEAEVAKHRTEEIRLRDQLKESGERELRLQQQVVRLKSSLTLEETQKRVHGALEKFNSEMTKPPLPATHVPGNSSHAAASAHGTCTQGEEGRRHLLSKYIALFRLVAGRHDGPPDGDHVNELDLSDCGLDDADVQRVVKLVCSCPRLAILNLSMNRIGDAAMESLATPLRQGSCDLMTVDLTSNQMSMEGVRKLAKALEENRSRGVSHVYVHREGRIDAIGRRQISACQLKQANRAGAEGKALEFYSVVVVDARDNHPPAAGTPSTLSPVARCGKRQLGGRTALASSSYKNKGLIVKPERTGGNKSTLARQSQVRDFMTKVAYR